METTANQRLKIWADSKQISVIQLSEIMEVSRQSVYDIFNNRRKVTAEQLHKIKLKYPDINRNYILFGDNKQSDIEWYFGHAESDSSVDESIKLNNSNKLDWREEAFTAIKEENTFLKKQLELLNNVVNTLLKNPNFPLSPLKTGKKLDLNIIQGVYSGDVTYKQSA